MYNCSKAIDRDAIMKLEFIADVTQYIQVKANEQNAVAKDYADIFPKLIWVVRDFTLQKKTKGKDITATEYLEKMLGSHEGISKKVREENFQREAIKDYFKQRKCYCFPSPSLDPEILNDLINVPEAELNPHFVEELKDLLQDIYQSPVKSLNDRLNVDGESFVQLAECYVGALLENRVPCPDKAFQSVAERTNAKLCQDCTTNYKQEMEKKCENFVPSTMEEVCQYHEVCKQQAMTEFQQKCIRIDGADENANLDIKIGNAYEEICQFINRKSQEQCSKRLNELYDVVKQKRNRQEYNNTQGLELFERDVEEIKNKFSAEPGLGVAATQALQSFLEKAKEDSYFIRQSQAIAEKAEQAEKRIEEIEKVSTEAQREAYAAQERARQSEEYAKQQAAVAANLRLVEKLYTNFQLEISEMEPKMPIESETLYGLYEQRKCHAVKLLKQDFITADGNNYQEYLEKLKQSMKEKFEKLAQQNKLALEMKLGQELIQEYRKIEADISIGGKYGVPGGYDLFAGDMSEMCSEFKQKYGDDEIAKKVLENFQHDYQNLGSSQVKKIEQHAVKFKQVSDDAETARGEAINANLVEHCTSLYNEQMKNVKLPLRQDMLEQRLENSQNEAVAYFEDTFVLKVKINSITKKPYFETLKDKLEHLASEFHKKNFEVSYEICCNLLIQKLYKPIAKDIAVNGKYAKEGGLEEYRIDVQTLILNYDEENDKGVAAERALTNFLETYITNHEIAVKSLEEVEKSKRATEDMQKVIQQQTDEATSKMTLLNENLKKSEETNKLLYHELRNLSLVNKLKSNGTIEDDAIAQVMITIQRSFFCPTNPFEDSPQGIGFSATISAPHMHAHTLRYLLPKLSPGNSALDVATGSGYLAACMAHLVGEKGYVCAIDINVGLVQQAKENICKLPKLKDRMTKNKLNVIEGNAFDGESSRRMYDVIHVGASHVEVPQKLLNQLQEGGILLMPIGPSSDAQKFTVFTKTQNVIEKKTVLRVSYQALTKEFVQS